MLKALSNQLATTWNLAKHCDLKDPESIKCYVANLDYGNGFKETTRQT